MSDTDQIPPIIQVAGADVQADGLHVGAYRNIPSTELADLGSVAAALKADMRLSDEAKSPMALSALGIDVEALPSMLARVRGIEAAASKAGAALAALAGSGKVPKTDMNLYAGDEHPVAGCTLVIGITEDKWFLSAYAPGYVAHHPISHHGLIENYAGRPHGSAGIAVDAFIQNRGDIRPAAAAMAKAQRDYAAVPKSDQVGPQKETPFLIGERGPEILVLGVPHP